MNKFVIALFAIALAVGSWNFLKVEAQAAPESKLEVKTYEDANCDDEEDDNGAA